MPLNDVAHAFAPGNRLRLALSTSYWPIAWPSPEPVTLSLRPASSILRLPVRPPRTEDAQLRVFEQPEAAAPDPSVDLHPGHVQRAAWTDATSGEHVLEIALDLTEEGEPALTRLEAIGLEAGHAIVETFRIHPDDPLSARTSIRHRVRSQRAGWSARVESSVELCASREAWRLRAVLEAFENEARVFVRTWDRSIPRP